MEIRSTVEKTHTKVNSKEAKFPIYNIHNALDNISYVVLTEGVFDAETLIQNGVNCVAGLRASISDGVLHLLSVFNKIYLALDNDTVGTRQTKRILKFYRDCYPDIDVDVLEYGYKDLNEILISGGDLSIIKDQIDF